jgi:predicted PurR-regulated permease PerM
VSDTIVVGRLTPGGKALTLAIVAGVALLLLPYVSGLVGALVLYIAAEPVVARVVKRAHRQRPVSVVVVLLMFAVLVIPALWLCAELFAQIPDALRSIEGSAGVQRLVDMRVGGVDVGAVVRSAGSELLSWSSRQTMVVVGGAVSATLNLVIALFGAYYLLISADDLWLRLRQLLPFCPTMSDLLRVRFRHVTEAMLLGVVLTGAAQGTLVSLAFVLLGLPHALFWGAVTAACSLLPILGSALVWLPASVLLLMQQRSVAAIVLALFGALVISNIDNALRLVVYKRVGSIHPMITLVGAFAGVSAFGVAGLLIGPLMLSYAVELLSVYRGPDVVALAEAA